MSTNKNKIIKAATACFVEKGFHDTSMRDIAKQAGVSIGNIYNHFPGKTDLVLAIAQDERADLSQVEDFFSHSAKPPIETIVEFSMLYLKELAPRETGILMLEIASEATRNKKVAAAFNTNRKTLVKLISTLLEHGQKTGSIDPNLNPQQGGEFILDLIEATALRAVVSAEKTEPAVKKELNFIIKKYLGV